MSDNVAPDDFTRSVPASRSEQLSLFDSLSPAWKRLVDSLPVKQDLREVIAVREKFGLEHGYELICETYEQQYPGWRRPT